jgi:hypothetical protein
MLIPMHFNSGTPTFEETPELVLLAHVDQDRSKRVVAKGTAFFVHVDSCLVLLTAAHVFDGLENQPILALGKKGHVSLAGKKVVRSKLFDVAAIILESSDIDDLMVELMCVEPIAVADVQDSGTDAIYQMHGFPGSKNTFSPTDGAKRHMARVSLGERRDAPKKSSLPLKDFQPFCFDISLKQLFNDEGIKVNTLTEFKGMSGSPVYRYEVTGTSKAMGQLVGMFVHWDKNERTASVIPWQILREFALLAISH